MTRVLCRYRIMVSLIEYQKHLVSRPQNDEGQIDKDWILKMN